MLEIGIAFAVVGIFVGVVVAAAAVPVLTLIWVGVATIIAGMALGLPAGVGYHVAMHRGLAASGIEAPKWWWSPVRYHDQLGDRGRRLVMPWFVAGVLGATLAFLGCAILVVCLFRLRGLEA
ncbi:MAG: hypothetical protein ACAI38_10755 [Myxococcota bacterium]|nr:hypothetical protein [Myxococcota bacterium]